MTDITELAQREKFEAWAEERCALPWGYLKNRRTNTGYFSKHDYTSLWAAWKAAGAELVEALEKAQTEVKRQENIASALFDEVSQLRRNADDKAPELKKIITEMEEENNRQVLEVMRLSSLVAELESRTVTVKLPDYRNTYKGPFADEVEHQVRLALELFSSAAGIKWEAE